MLYELAKEYKELGKRVLVTTTTHMYREGKYGFTPRGRDIEGEKICGYDPSIPKTFLKEYDVVLVEADGSRRLPVKMPESFEPVVPDGADLVIAVAGAFAIGKPLETVCHRAALAEAFLKVKGDHLLTETDLIAMLTSEKGQKKQVSCEYRYLINQADLLTKEQKDRLIQLMKETKEIGILGSMIEEEV